MGENYTIEQASSELLQKFYDGSALTFIGISHETVCNYVEYLNRITPLKDGSVVYEVSGESINTYYDVDEFPDDINIAVIELDSFEDWKKLILKRFEFGGRWFDDVIDNIKQRWSDEDED
jgi:hypothetical protein